MNKLIIIYKKSEWDNIINGFMKTDIYYSFEYGNLFAKMENGSLFAAYYENGSGKIFYPFIKRSVPFLDHQLFDIVTPYGYGGPLIDGKIESAMEFYKLFGEYCIQNHIITETIRFHPLLQNHKRFENILDLNYVRRTTAVNLTRSLKDIRGSYSSMNKRNIKKAKNSGLICYEAEKTKKNIEIFVDLYKETMDRNNATSYYYFYDSYFKEQLLDTSISETCLLFVKWKEEVIAGVMVIVGKEFAHYHLGASKSKYLNLKPNNFLYDYMIEYCKAKNSKLLHLGGGYQEDDGLFKFKSSFSNNNNFAYYIGKKIYDKEQYHSIVDNITNDYVVDESYFPIYRSKLERKIEVKG